MQKLNDLESTIDFWLNVLEKYSLEQLTLKYHKDKWSLGQVIIHLIESSTFFLDNANACLQNDLNKDEPLSVSAGSIFLKNELPNVELKGPASNSLTPQPISLALLKEELESLKISASQVRQQLEADADSGKIAHPGLGYFNATQWFQFADIHMRHHIDQLPKIEAQLLKL